MTVSIETEDSYIRTLERYDDMETAQKALRKLFCALRDGAETFEMPPDNNAEREEETNEG